MSNSSYLGHNSRIRMFANRNYRLHFFTVAAISYWNQLMQKDIEVSSVASFKARLTLFFHKNNIWQVSFHLGFCVWVQLLSLLLSSPFPFELCFLFFVVPVLFFFSFLCSFFKFLRLCFLYLVHSTFVPVRGCSSLSVSLFFPNFSQNYCSSCLLPSVSFFPVPNRVFVACREWYSWLAQRLLLSVSVVMYRVLVGIGSGTAMRSFRLPVARYSRALCWMRTGSSENCIPMVYCCSYLCTLLYAVSLL